MSRDREKEIFLTTGQIAERCGVNFRTVIRWIQKGYLKAHRLPGRGDHRVALAEFERFMQSSKMALPTLEKAVSQSPKKVLIVDDDPLMVQSIRRVLRNEGYETAQAHNGFEAGLLVQSFKPDLITLDIMMQGMDGFAVLQGLREKKILESTKVLVVTGDQDRNVQKMLNLGATKALAKPFQNKELLGLINELLGEGA